MYMKGCKKVLVAWVVLLLLCATGAASAGAKTLGQTTGAVEFAPGIQHVRKIRDLQPIEWPGVKISVGDGQAHSIIQGDWRLEIGYRYTAQGWQFASYRAERVDHWRSHSHAQEPSGNESGQVHLDLRLGDPNVPPHPEDYPPPPTPAHPDDSSHGAISYRCPFAGTEYDVKAVYHWVPDLAEHDDDANSEKQTPGHWKLTNYTNAPHPADFCGG